MRLIHVSRVKLFTLLATLHLLVLLVCIWFLGTLFLHYPINTSATSSSSSLHISYVVNLDKTPPTHKKVAATAIHRPRNPFYEEPLPLNNLKQQPKAKSTKKEHPGVKGHSECSWGSSHDGQRPTKGPWSTRSGHVIWTNFIRASRHFVGNQSVTLATHGTHEFLEPHLGILAHRWAAPISVSLFAPGTDLDQTLEAVQYQRFCSPHASLIRELVSFHLVYPVGDARHSAHETTATLCRMSERPDRVHRPTSCTASARISQSAAAAHKDYRNKHHVTYPVNVARNAARISATTDHVLTSDIELYPSEGVVRRFLPLIRQLLPQGFRERPHVFVLPIFEVASDQLPPADKAHLVRLVRQSKAVYFHRNLCADCSRIPKLSEWLALPLGHQNAPLKVFHAAKRRAPTRWEPIYIGTQSEPLYDESMSWEGYHDKISQVFEMCLLDYDFLILNDAFLVHTPGIKKFNMTAYRQRQKIGRANTLHFEAAKKALRQRYRKNKWAKAC